MHTDKHRSKPTDQASPKRVLNDNRRHWGVEVCHFIIDWNYDEDRRTIRIGYGSENITRLRRFAIGFLKRKETIPETMKKLLMNRQAVFDFLKMTRNSNALSMSEFTVHEHKSHVYR